MNERLAKKEVDFRVACLGCESSCKLTSIKYDFETMGIMSLSFE